MKFISSSRDNETK